MNTNQQFSMSIHVLTLLAAMPGDLLTSEQIAESVNTNPVVIRRMMGHLRGHGLVESRTGVSGGWKLTRPAEQIHLCQVYDAVTHEDLLNMHRHPSEKCPIGAGIRPVLDMVFLQAEKAMRDTLSGFTVADMLEKITSKNAEEK